MAVSTLSDLGPNGSLYVKIGSDQCVGFLLLRADGVAGVDLCVCAGILCAGEWRGAGRRRR